MDKKYLSFIYISGSNSEESSRYGFGFDGSMDEIEQRVREELDGFDWADAVVISGDEVLFVMGNPSESDVDSAFDMLEEINIEEAFKSYNLMGN